MAGKITRGKKGASHIEIVLSFVIFLGFLIFLIAIFKPFDIIRGGETYLDIAERGIKEKGSVELRFLTLKLDENKSLEKCFCFDYGFEDVIVKDKNYEVVNARSKKGKEEKICIDSAEYFFYIYSYKDFVENNFDSSECISLGEGDYTLGLFRSYDLLSWKKLNSIREEYEANYTDIKSEFGVPASKDFSFSIRKTGEDEVILETEKKPGKGVRVLARSSPVQIAYSNGTLKYAILNIQTW
ncbi:MAG: hypothetical protein AABX71_02725 [Nanoarchaeota archaeon]